MDDLQFKRLNSNRVHKRAFNDSEDDMVVKNSKISPPINNANTKHTCGIKRFFDATESKHVTHDKGYLS